MAQIKHRPFNADRFLDKFKGHEAYLHAYLAKWLLQIPGLNGAVEVEAFKDFLKSPPASCRPFEEMVKGLYRAYDLCTSNGEEIMREVADAEASPLRYAHDVHREIFALRLLVEDEAVFDLAEGLNYFQQLDRFTTFKGKGACSVLSIDEAAAAFKAELETFFMSRKGSDKVIVRHFLDEGVINFIVYHEERRKADIRFEGSRVTPIIYRPARQDFISFFQSDGRLQIDNPSVKETAAMRQAFGRVCLGDEDFFESVGADSVIDLTLLADPDYTLETDSRELARLTEIHFILPQAQQPKFTVASRNVFESLELNGLRAALASGTIRSAKLNLILLGTKRPKSILLKMPNRLSFNRATHAERVQEYLKRWGLLVA